MIFIYVLFPYFLLQWSIPTPFFKFIIFKIILVISQMAYVRGWGKWWEKVGWVVGWGGWAVRGGLPYMAKLLNVRRCPNNEVTPWPAGNVQLPLDNTCA